MNRNLLFCKRKRDKSQPRKILKKFKFTESLLIRPLRPEQIEIMWGSGDVFQDMAAVLSDLRQRSQLCDGTIRTQNGKKFKIHRAIVSASSPYFRALFTNTLTGVEATEVCVPNLTSDILNLLLDYAYTGRVNVTSANVETLLPAADRFQVTGVVQQCCDFLSKELKLENCVGIYMVSKHYFCPVLEESARSFLMVNFSQVSRKSPEFPLLQYEELETMLRSDDLNVKNEEQIFASIIRWIEHDPNDRRRYLPHLLSTVRFGLCDHSFVRSTVMKNSMVKSLPECQTSILKAMMVLDSDTTLLALHHPLDHPLGRPRVPHEVLFVVGGWSSGSATSCMETYDNRAKQWFINDCSDVMPRAYHGLVALDNMIYMIGGFDGNQCFNSVRCFDPVKRVWSERSCMYVARCYVSVTVMNGQIYALGGYDGRVRTNSGERYDPRRNQWTMIASMNRQRSDASATAFKDKVYIVGGFNGHEVLISAEVYDPSANTWTFIKSMTSARSGVNMVTYRNAIYVLGGFNGMTRLASGEKYDVRRDQWTDIANMSSPRSNFATAVMDGLLYVIGGFNGTTTIYAAECYNERDDEWLDAPSMNLNRSALSACVLIGLPNARDFTYLGLGGNS